MSDPNEAARHLVKRVGYDIIIKRASVAQLVEQRFRKARVGGSSPLAGCSYWCIVESKSMLHYHERDVFCLVI